MKDKKMYSVCIDNKNTRLEEFKEYQVVEVKSLDGFGDIFFVLEDGIAYASIHFSVTYLR